MSELSLQWQTSPSRMPRRKRSSHASFKLDPETGKGILTVVILVIAGLLFLSVFDLAGRLGVAIDSSMANAFGWDRIFLPFFLLAIGVHEMAPERFPLKITNYIGFVLFYLSMNPFVHTAAVVPDQPMADQLQKLGGKLGMMISDPFVSLLGRPAAGVVLFGLLIVSLLLIFNTSLKRVVDTLARFFAMLAGVGMALAAPFRWIGSRKAESDEARVRSQVPIPAGPSPEPEEEDEEEEETEEETDEDADEDERSKDEATTPAPPPKPKKRQPRIEIPLELLARRDQKPTSGDIARNQHVIQRTLETFGIPVEMGDVSVGPTVTQFTLKPSEGVKLSRSIMTSRSPWPRTRSASRRRFRACRWSVSKCRTNPSRPSACARSSKARNGMIGTRVCHLLSVAMSRASLGSLISAACRTCWSLARPVQVSQCV